MRLFIGHGLRFPFPLFHWFSRSSSNQLFSGLQKLARFIDVIDGTNADRIILGIWIVAYLDVCQFAWNTLHSNLDWSFVRTVR